MSIIICSEKEKTENCRFKIFDLKENKVFCNFFKKYWDAFHSYGSKRANYLIKKTCEKIKNYELHQIHISKLHSKETIEMLKSIVKGDTLFWVPRSEEVILTEKPYEINVSVRCKCLRFNKEIVKIPALLLRQISKGTFSGEYLIHKAKNNENKAQKLEHLAKYYGFRVEVKKKEKNLILKLYGDSQQKVDNFINLYIKQRRVLEF